MLRLVQTEVMFLKQYYLWMIQV